MESSENGPSGRAVDTPARGVGLSFVELFGIHGYQDTDGRLLGEHRAVREGYRGAPTKHAVCPYHGSRFKAPQPMNVSALKQMADAWDDIIDSLSFLHDAYVKLAEIGDEPMSLAHVWRTFVLGTTLPPYLFFRESHPYASGELPASVAACYKVLLGMKYTAEEMILSAILAGESTELIHPSGQALFDYAEEHGLLVGEEEVCAGAPKSILETLETVAEGRPRKKREGTLPIQKVIDDSGKWAAFSHSSLALFCSLLVFLTEANHLQDRLLEATGKRKRGLATMEPTETGPEVSMILALGLKHIVWKLAPMAREARRAGCITYLQNAGLTEGTETGKAVWDILPDSEQAQERAVAQQLRGSVAGLVGPELADELTDILSSYVCVERRALNAMTLAERDLNKALGRPAPEKPVDGSALMGYCGSTIVQELRERLGPSFELRYGGGKTEVALDQVVVNLT